MMAVISSYPEDRFESRGKSSKRHNHSRHDKYEIETKEEGEIVDEESEISDPKYRYPIVDDPFGDRYNPGGEEDEPVRKRSRSGDDHVREKRSRSKALDDGVCRQREKGDRHGSKDRDRERERSGSYGRQDKRDEGKGSRDRKREQSSSERYDRRDDGKGSGYRKRERRSSDRYERREDKHVREGSRERGKERSNGSGRHDSRVDRHGSRDLERKKERERGSSLGRHVQGEERAWSGSLGKQDRREEREQCDKKIVGDGVMNMDIDEDREGAMNIVRERMDSQDVQSESRCPEDGDSDLDTGDYNFQVDEDECDDVLEKSRKLKEAIMKKHEQQLQKKQDEHHAEITRTVENSSLANDKPIIQISLIERNSGTMNSTPNHVVENVPSTSERTLDAGIQDDITLKSEEMALCAGIQEDVTLKSEELALGAGIQDNVTLKSEELAGSFCDDMFGETPEEGYYSFRIGELLDDRYEVIASHGKGVFSTVVRAKDHKAGDGEPEEVAIKFVRSNDTMLRSGRTEEKFLKKLSEMDPEDRCHCVRFISSFMHRNHICLVIESLSMNLRSVVKKFGRDIGLNLKAVRGYAKQLFIALKHLQDCDVLHCDIKPDNILVNEAKSALKLCDFGNATLNNDPTNNVTPYMVSRYYRAPEIMLGLQYHHPIDMWSVGCCLYELYAGKILFNGSSNKEMLRLHMELKGPFTKKMLKKGAFTGKYFDHNFNFIPDPGTKALDNKPRKFSTIITGSGEDDRKLVANFRDILEKIFVLDPEKRLTVTQASNHPFITG
ncbi:non-specific serine/threonine protein kinase [Ranunculus cassubicifolius]